MNISDLTLARLNKKVNKRELLEDEPEMAEPIKDVKSLFSDNLEAFASQVTESPQEQYQKFLADNIPEDPKTADIYGSVGLSDLFRKCASELSEEQRMAFQGIESVRNYLDSTNCNCVAKKAKMEEYYRGFILGNSENDLLSTVKEKTKLEKITFYYENQSFFEI